MAASDKLGRSTQLAILKTLARVGNADDLSLVLQAAENNPSASADLLAELQDAYQSRSITPQTDLDRLRQFVFSDDANTKTKAISLTGVWKVASLFDHVLATAKDDQATTDVRHAALVSLGRIGGDESKEALEDSELAALVSEKRATA